MGGIKPKISFIISWRERGQSCQKHQGKYWLTGKGKYLNNVKLLLQHSILCILNLRYSSSEVYRWGEYISLESSDFSYKSIGRAVGVGDQTGYRQEMKLWDTETDLQKTHYQSRCLHARYCDYPSVLYCANRANVYIQDRVNRIPPFSCGVEGESTRWGNACRGDDDVYLPK